jgi:hypothetical protein
MPANWHLAIGEDDEQHFCIACTTVFSYAHHQILSILEDYSSCCMDNLTERTILARRLAAAYTCGLFQKTDDNPW